MLPRWRIGATLLIIAICVPLLMHLAPGRSQEEKMLSAWLREARLLFEWDYTGDGRIDTSEYDTNGDSIADLWINVREEAMPEGIYKMTRWEKDRNHDGKVDWQFEESFRPFASRKHVKSIAEDTNHDGVFDYSAFLEGRRKITYMQSYDTDGDGRYDRVVRYNRDQSAMSETRYYFLPEVARENNASTDPSGFNYRETDVDMDGKIDIFEVWVFRELGPTYWERVNQSSLETDS